MLLSLLFLLSAQVYAQVSYKMLLPGKHLTAIPKLLQEASASDAPSLLITSGESYSGKGDNVLNRIRFYQKDGFDIWLMDQNIAGLGFDFSKWSHIAIVVEKGLRRDTAYYFEYQILGGHILPIPFEAACYRCHSSGPRVIRPQKSAWTQDLTPEQQRQLKSWNKTIADYGAVETHWPKYDPDSDESPIKLNDPHQDEPLTMLKCTGCHNSSTGQRAPLLRQHKDSILYLINHGWDADEVYSMAGAKQAHMPLHKGTLTDEDRKRLEDWLKK
jgi:hypothetical protein